MSFTLSPHPGLIPQYEDLPVALFQAILKQCEAKTLYITISYSDKRTAYEFETLFMQAN